jgi:nucleoside-diphosphate-sugar epimerase
VYASTLKVHGESTEPDRPFVASSPLKPEDAYARSKAEAEESLAKIVAGTDTELVIVRPPLVYGPRVKGNLASLSKALRNGMPLPLGTATRNRRSLVGVDNLVDLFVESIRRPHLGCQVYLVSDDEDVSTVGLLEVIGMAMGRKPRLVSVPESVIKGLAALAGRRSVFDRLFGSLQVDIEYTKRSLGWRPRITMHEGIRRMLAAEGRGE